MRRYPHISLFRKHINSPNEWAVVTDKNLNVVAAKEAGWNVPPEVQRQVIEEARANLPRGRQDIYFFHSHPRTGERRGINVDLPSKADYVAFGNRSRAAYDNRLNVRGEGVMSQHGVNVINISRRGQHYKEIPEYEDKQLTIRLREGAESRGINKDNYHTKSHRDMARLLAAASRKSYEDTKEKFPEMSTGHIKRQILRPADIRPRNVIRRKPYPTIEWDRAKGVYRAAKRVYIGDLPEDEQEFIRSLPGEEYDPDVGYTKGKYLVKKKRTSNKVLDNRMDEILYGTDLLRPRKVQRKKKRDYGEKGVW